MAQVISGDVDLKYDRLCVIPLGGQSEIGLVLWILAFGGEFLLVDAGAAYPTGGLPGVDLLLPNTNFLEANQDRIKALLLTNGHEEHCGAVTYLLNHLKIPRIMGPRFVANLISQKLLDKQVETVVDTVELKHPYEIGPFRVQWIQQNNAIADACALQIDTPEGVVIYTSSFKLDQTPVDGRFLDIASLAQTGDAGVLLLLSASAGVETAGYTPSERAVKTPLKKHLAMATGRVIAVIPGTNTHRLQILFDLAAALNRRVILYGETLIQTAVVAVITGNLSYDRKLEAAISDLNELSDEEVLVVATGVEGDPIEIVSELAYGKNKDISVKEGDTVIFCAAIPPGYSRQMAMILDQFLSQGVHTVVGTRDGVNVEKHAYREELKLMLSIVNPRLLVPCIGEGRHIMHHAQLAVDWGMPPESVFPLRNGDILEIGGGQSAVIGAIESQAVLYNRDQGERVTTFSVQERKSLSSEGVLTISCVVSGKGELLSGPVIEAGASAFLLSEEWQEVQEELLSLVLDTIHKARTADVFDVAALRLALRDGANKFLRSRLQAKPLVQALVHEVEPAEQR